jgi:hypothetical protein
MPSAAPVSSTVRPPKTGHYHVADALTAEKNYREATNEGRRALEIYEGLAAADPKNVGERDKASEVTRHLAACDRGRQRG